MFSRPVVIGLLCCTTSSLIVAEEKPFPPGEDASADYQTEVILEGLENPSGLVLRPTAIEDGTDEFFFAESGAGRVIRFPIATPKDTREVLSGLETHSLVEEKPVKFGPWALGFLTPKKLLVLGGVLSEGEEQAGVYVLPENGAQLLADKTDHLVGPLATGMANGRYGFPGLAIGETTAYFSSGSENASVHVYRAPIEANRLETLRPVLSTQSAKWPTGLSLSPRSPVGSQYLVAGYLGTLKDLRDSQIVFLAPGTGDQLLKLSPGLFDIVGLAYSPSGQLYAVDLAWQQTEEGGIYRLDDALWNGRPACRAVKVARVAHPTSLAFDGQGVMYVTALGSIETAKQGQILKITGEF